MCITRSSKNTSGLLAFGGCFLLAFVVLLVVWGYITPVYNQIVASVASPIFRLVESDNVTALRADGSKLLVGRRAGDGTVQPFLYFDPYIYFGLIPLIALLLAVPGPGILRRLKRTLIGIVILFVVFYNIFNQSFTISANSSCISFFFKLIYCITSVIFIASIFLFLVTLLHMQIIFLLSI